MTSLEGASLRVRHEKLSLAGATRRDLAELVDKSLLALRPWATPGHALINLPGPVSAAGRSVGGLEAFARSFLSAGFLLSGGDADPHDHAGWYARGLAAGVDPTSRERWGSLQSEAQNRVEAAAIAIALHESREQVWERLAPRVQELIVDWLSGSTGAWYPESNWFWFHNVTHAFLRSVGAPHDQARIEAMLEYLDGCYAGAGWYSDGHEGGHLRNFDWYSGWVMQQFPLWYCRMSAGVPGIEERRTAYAERLRSYIAAAIDLHGSDGAPLFQGRSLVYRFATVGALWTGAVADASPVELGQLRRVAMRTIDYFVRRGSYNDAGLLTLGWHGAFPEMRQTYSGPGSPYWASLGFAGLVLPESHPLWTTPDEPAPLEAADRVVPIPTIGWLVSGTHEDGIVRVVNHGVDHSAAAAEPEHNLYARLAYSTVTGPLAASTGSDQGAVDNQIALIDNRGRWSHRAQIRKGPVHGRQAESTFTAHFADADGGLVPGPRVRVVSFVRGATEVRAARIETHFTGEALVMSGYATPRRPSPGARVGLSSGVVSLTQAGVSGVSTHAEQTPFGADIVVPWVRFEAPESGRWYVTAITLATHSAREYPVLSESENGVVRIDWPDESFDTLY